MQMDGWVPLLQIFLNSPTPETDASLWLQHQHNHHRSLSTPNDPTSAFISLLQTPKTQQLIWIQALPPFTQSRILSFLSAAHRRLSRRRLRSLADHVLRSPTPDNFWAQRSARQLFDAVTPSDPDPFDPLQDQKAQNQRAGESQEAQFVVLPHWLQCHTASTTPLLPWLPLASTQIRKRAPLPTESPGSLDLVVEQAHSARPKSWVHHLNQLLDPHASPPERPEPLDLVAKQANSATPKSLFRNSNQPLDPRVQDKASTLKAEILAMDSAAEAFRVSTEIRNLCVYSGTGNQLKVLGLIEPWEVDDETTSLLLSNLSGNGELGSIDWSAHILGSIMLPKLVSLGNSASRVLLSATIAFCKLHQTAAVEGLLFPLLLLKEGINFHHHDVVSRVIKECLHPSHVSAFCQRLLCWEGEDRSLVCQPCHRELFGDEVVWSEPLFTLFQNILNQNVHLTPDTINRLVFVIAEMANKYTKSLKFGNFLLCFVTKCQRASSYHKVLLEQATQKTDTFVTKSVLSKLADQMGVGCM